MYTTMLKNENDCDNKSDAIYPTDVFSYWLLYKLTKEVVLRVKLSVFLVAVDQMLQFITKSKLILKSVKNRKLDLCPR